MNRYTSMSVNRSLDARNRNHLCSYLGCSGTCLLAQTKCQTSTINGPNNNTARKPDENVENVKRLLRWRNQLYRCLTSHGTLNEVELVQLVNFLDHAALWTKRLVETSIDLCVFCRNNNESYEVYTSHKVKDRVGRVTCPILRQFTCPVCGATGDRAHTIRYCPRLVTNDLNSTGPSMHLMEAGVLDPALFTNVIQPQSSSPSLPNPTTLMSRSSNLF